jgi:hypothetical protein
MPKHIDAAHMDKYIDGKLVKKGESDEPSKVQKFYWWRERENREEMGMQILSTCKFLKDQQHSRIEQLISGTRLYGQADFNFFGSSLSRTSSYNNNPGTQRISFNLCSSVIDTLTASIAKNKVIPTFVTEGGVWGMQQKAKKLSKFTEGMFYEQDVHEKGVYVQGFWDLGRWYLLYWP